MPRCGKAVNDRISLVDLSSSVSHTGDFLGRPNQTRGHKEKPMWLAISFTDLDPNGCLSLRSGRAENLLDVLMKYEILD